MQVLRIALVLAVLGLGALATACKASEAAAARDPMSCERDPNCAKYRGSYSECTRQCADNPECVDRCRSAQTDPDIGH
jgi:hypothetical protein